MNTIIKNTWSLPQIKATNFKETQLLTQIIGLKKEKGCEKRKPLNISFVFDVSGSMGMMVSRNDNNFNKSPLEIHRGFNNINGNHLQWQSSLMQSGQTKLDLVKQAALVALSGLDKNDIVSIVVFGSTAEVLMKGASGDQQEKLSNIIKGIRLNGNTALFDGWSTGATCVAENMKEGYINRVMLLTDGEANVGLTQSDEICTRVRKLSDNDVTTSTFGVGNSYNEDLLQGMSESGDGNYYYIKDENDFESMFSHEFGGLVNLVGRKVLLFLEYTGWKDFNLLNDFEKNNEGLYRLPNLTTLSSLDLIFEGTPSEENASVKISVCYDVADGSKEEIKSIINVDTILNEKDEYKNQDVIDKVVLIKIANKKRDAIRALDNGDRELAEKSLGMARGFLATASAGVSSLQDGELNALNTSLVSGQTEIFRKSASYQSYNARNSKIK